MPYRQLVGVGPDGRMVIDDPDPALLAAHELLTTSAHGIGGEWFSTYLDRGFTRAGLTAGQAGYFFEEFTDVARWQKLAGAASLAAVTTLAGGVVEIAAGIGDDVIYVVGSGAFGMATLAQGSQKWYVGGRMRFPVALGAGATTQLGMASFTPQVISAGYRQLTDATHFSAMSFIGGGLRTATSSVLVDANAHDVELWHNNGDIFLAVDNETPVVLPVAASPSDMLTPYLEVATGGAAGITQQLDKFLCVFPQAA